MTIISSNEQNIAYGLLCLAVDVALPCEAALPCWVMDGISYYKQFLWVIHKTSPLKGDWIKELDFKLRGKGYTIRHEQLPDIQEYISTVLAPVGGAVEGLLKGLHQAIGVTTVNNITFLVIFYIFFKNIHR